MFILVINVFQKGPSDAPIFLYVFIPVIIYYGYGCKIFKKISNPFSYSSVKKLHFLSCTYTYIMN